VVGDAQVNGCINGEMDWGVPISSDRWEDGWKCGWMDVSSEEWVHG
jgi:hypothetical protein